MKGRPVTPRLHSPCRKGLRLQSGLCRPVCTRFSNWLLPLSCRWTATANATGRVSLNASMCTPPLRRRGFVPSAWSPTPTSALPFVSSSWLSSERLATTRLRQRRRAPRVCRQMTMTTSWSSTVDAHEGDLNRAFVQATLAIGARSGCAAAGGRGKGGVRAVRQACQLSLRGPRSQ
jgi:hypothetical protein